MSSSGFTHFSRKQLGVLTWWLPSSPHKDRDAVICDGAVRSGKTLCMTVSFIAWAMTMFDSSSFAICGKTISSVRRNIAAPVFGVLRCCGFSIKEKISAIHAPYAQGGQACHGAFADIIDCLVFDSGLEITESGCGNITADRDTDALVLPAYAVVNANLCPAGSSDLDFPSFIDKTLLCGSHIRNTAIHLSESQQEYLAEPFFTGTYTGLGDSVRNVSLGFRPSVFIVFAGGLPFIVTGGSFDRVYCGVASGESGSIGLTLTASGFRVNSGDSYAVSTSSPRLNETGITYTYIAFR